MGGGRATRSSGTPATAALARAGVPFTVHEYLHDPAVTDFGQEAVRALGVPAERVFKTLLVQGAAGLAVAIVPVPARLDLKAAAAALGTKRLELAEPAIAERRTGYVVGGISPIGQRHAHPTVLDDSALEHATVFVSGGRRGMDVELAPGDLLAVTGATTARLRSV